MSRYRLKVEPKVEVGAVQYLGFEENGEECERFLGDSFETHLPSEDKIVFCNLEGETTASKGDWLINGLLSELFWHREPDVFEANYEPAET
jgi:hypothetical protein